jgi:hypothetical protein
MGKKIVSQQEYDALVYSCGQLRVDAEYEVYTPEGLSELVDAIKEGTEKEKKEAERMEAFAKKGGDYEWVAKGRR